MHIVSFVDSYTNRKAVCILCLLLTRREAVCTLCLINEEYFHGIAVMDDGRIKEMDTPANLLGDNQSRLYAMAKEANLV